MRRRAAHASLALVTDVPQLIGLIVLPTAGNIVLGIAALAAAIERALRFKSNRWLG